MKQDTFPKSIALGDRAVGWMEREVNEWIETRHKRSIKGLLTKRFIERVHEGGKGPRDPHQYQFILRG